MVTKKPKLIKGARASGDAGADPFDLTEVHAALAKLASRLGHLTEGELELLAGVTSGTAESWRRRGQGPAFTRIGNRIFYADADVAAFLKQQVRERHAVDAKAVL